MKPTYIGKNNIVKILNSNTTKACIRGDIKYLCHNDNYTYFKSLRDYVEFNQVEHIISGNKIIKDCSEKIYPNPVICKKTNYYVVYPAHVRMNCGDLLFVKGKLSDHLNNLIEVTCDKDELPNFKHFIDGNMYLSVEPDGCIHYLQVEFTEDADYHPYFIRNPHYKE